MRQRYGGGLANSVNRSASEQSQNQKDTCDGRADGGQQSDRCKEITCLGGQSSHDQWTEKISKEKSGHVSTCASATLCEWQANHDPIQHEWHDYPAPETCNESTKNQYVGVGNGGNDVEACGNDCE